MDGADFHSQAGRTSPLGHSCSYVERTSPRVTKLCSEFQTNCEDECLLDSVRASTRGLSVGCGEKRLLC